MPAKTVSELMRAGRSALNLHMDTSLARFLGVSRRTVYRHSTTGGFPDAASQAKFVRALHPVDPATARTLARVFQVDIQDLEAKASPALPPAPAPTPVSPPAVTKEHVALVTLAAANALNMVPRDVQPALATIFSAALELGVDLNELAKLLAPARKPPNKKSTSP